MKYVFRAEYQRNKRIDFKRTSGDLKEFEGSWVLESVNGGKPQTLVVYSVFLDAGFLLPQWAMQLIIRQDLPGILLSLRNRIGSPRTTSGPRITMKIAYVVTIAGIAGDMTLAAFVSAGLSLEELSAELRKLGIGGFELHAAHVRRSHIDLQSTSMLRSQIHRNSTVIRSPSTG